MAAKSTAAKTGGERKIRAFIEFSFVREAALDSDHPRFPQLNSTATGLCAELIVAAEARSLQWKRENWQWFQEFPLRQLLAGFS
jgi:hypothetical protein